ncbi:lysophospholipase L1-like esterase [Bacillus pakistanensis]|uniref:Lysophospholipase L1-like esterase n=1 Tax=Rossellomorea pakistanensis TaxID=992288 RepID=A0ABS2N8T8_9BACI|nr:SGNH/GDSL hydrolase family protein [Bacillus pakistanensis]MBM7584248.1 lysophospholipase L1-like esterase [Bacillus pakistanensis]
MRKAMISLFTFLILLSGCSVDNMTQHVMKELELDIKSDPPENFIPKDLKVVSIGDSLTQGVGDSTKSGGYIPYLQTQLESLKAIKEAKFTNYGVRGNRTDQLLKRLNKEKIKESIDEADLVIITIGGNDVMKTFKENISNLKIQAFESAMVDYEKRLHHIIQKIQSYNPNAGIVLIGIYNPFSTWFSDIKELNQIIVEWNTLSSRVIGEYNQTEFVEVQNMFLNSERNLLFEEDYFHPNDLGYELMANRMFKILTQRETLNELTNNQFLLKEEEQPS